MKHFNCLILKLCLKSYIRFLQMLFKFITIFWKVSHNIFKIYIFTLKDKKEIKKYARSNDTGEISYIEGYKDKFKTS